MANIKGTLSIILLQQFANLLNVFQEAKLSGKSVNTFQKQYWDVTCGQLWVFIIIYTNEVLFPFPSFRLLVGSTVSWNVSQILDGFRMDGGRICHSIF